MYRGIATIRCESISDFHAIHSKHFQNLRGLIFRGHSNIRWRVESSLARAVKEHRWDSESHPEALRFECEERFPRAFAEFLYRLRVLGDREARDLLDEYHGFWESSSGFDRVEEFRRMILRTPHDRKLFDARRMLRYAEFRLLAIAQHYGMPTPLIDWTSSPYIAWYFALSEDQAFFPSVVAISPQSFEHQVGNWLKAQADQVRNQLEEEYQEQLRIRRESSPNLVVDREQILGMFSLEDIVSVSEFCQYPALSHLNDRLPMQQGILTKHSVRYTLESIIRRLSKDIPNKTFMYKFVLTKEAREKALINLRLMNITGATLFPGIHGAALLGRDCLRFDGYSARLGEEDLHGFA